MKLYRVVRLTYSDQEVLSGEGARKVGGRWNRKGTPAVYGSENASLAMLEKLTGISNEARDKNFKLYILEFSKADNIEFKEFRASDLPDNWREYPAPPETQAHGSDILRKTGGDSEQAEFQALIVPSVICPMERNIIIPPGLAEISNRTVSEFTYDERILPED